MIRTATAHDRDAVIALWHAAALIRPWNDAIADYDRALSSAASTILVAEDGGTIAGSIMVGDDGHRGWVYYLAVAPEARRSGTGRALMAAAEAWLHARGCAKIQLMVREGNRAAVAFYEALDLVPQPVTTFGKFLVDG